MIKKFFRLLYWKWWDIRHKQRKRPFGISCYIGLPGSGKTLSLSEKLMQLKTQFPKAKIYTNFGWRYQNDAIKDWRDLIEYENGEDGIIFGLDEVHSVFDRYDAGKIPREILEVFSQNRKMAKQMLCTAQSYADILVDIRRRCHYIIECRNFLNRWIFQKAFAPEDYKEKDGEYTARQRAWRYSFIATNFIYDSYDTYAVIRNIKEQLKETVKIEKKEEKSLSEMLFISQQTIIGSAPGVARRVPVINLT